MQKKNKRLLYINYYSGVSLATVVDSLYQEDFAITVLDLRIQQNGPLMNRNVSIIDGGYIKNKADLTAYLHEHAKGFDLVFTFSEILVEFVAGFCKEVGLPYSCDQVITHSRNKFLQRVAWSKESDLKFFLIESREDLEKITLQEGICKPVNGMGSIGVRRVTLDQLKRDYEIFITQQNEDTAFDRFGLIDTKLIFEEFVETDISFWCGDYPHKESFSGGYIIDGFVSEGYFVPSFMLAHLRHSAENVIYGTISPPPTLSEEYKNKIFNFVGRRVKMLGFKNTIVHAEVILGKEGNIEMLEVASRPGGRANQEALKRISHFNPILKYVTNLLSLPVQEKHYSEGVKSRHVASVAIMPVDKHGYPFSGQTYEYVDINKGLSLVINDLSSTVELVSAKTLLSKKRGEVKRVSSATVYALLLVTNNSYENLLQDVNYIRENQHLFFLGE